MLLFKKKTQQQPYLQDVKNLLTTSYLDFITEECIVHFYIKSDFKRPNELYTVHLLSTSTLLTPNNQ